MIDRRKENKIGAVVFNGVKTHFYFAKEERKDERNLAKPIFNKQNMTVIAIALMEQLESELEESCRTELVKNVYVDVSDIYVTEDKEDINMDFYVDYLIKSKRVKGTHLKKDIGFTCGTTLCRYNIIDNRIYQVSNKMFDRCDVM